MPFKFSKISQDGEIRRIQKEIEDNFISQDKNGNVVLSGNITAQDGYFAANSIYLDKIKISKPANSEANFVLVYDNSKRELVFTDDVSGAVTALPSYHASSHESGGADALTHDNINGSGSNTHVQIDTHIADNTIHFTETSIDHGSIAGLSDDDHTQYLLANGTRDLTGDWTIATNNITLTSGTLTANKILIGAGNDLELYHNATNSLIDNNTGELQICDSATPRIRIDGTGIGFFNTAPVAKPSALTAQLTTITHTAPGTPDYAIQNLTNSSPYGFVTQDEGNTVLSVIANLQTRVSEIETKIQSLGLLN